ncbi:MAG: hypothetical protein B6I34_10815 [Anaerolineaceae bacterium 4572_32.1]|nr:MAG: hypothetical protein B6I34_10815 [Anaerolineaceae bacterium 4572_32.1]
MDHNVIIIGAGPAGLSTGLHLAQLAPALAKRTLILEKEHHPRPKLCAGGITPGGEAWLRRLGLDLSAVTSVDVSEAHFLFDGRGFVVRHEPYVFRVVRRDEFDAWLADTVRERGLTLQEDTWVRRVQRLKDSVAVETNQGTYHARAVVGADGATGVVRQAIAHGQPSRTSRLLEILAPPTDLQNSLSLDPQKGKVVIDFSWIADGLQGYVWDFPTQVRKQPMHTRGIFDSRVHPRAPRVSLKVVLQEEFTRVSAALGHHELEGHPLRCFHPRGVFSAPRVLLVGDAAGVDPLLGEGISFALGYGEVAAQELVDGFAHGDFSFERYRRHVLTHRIGRYMRRRASIAALLYRIRSRFLLRSLGSGLGPLVGWMAEHFWVDWGE